MKKRWRKNQADVKRKSSILGERKNTAISFIIYIKMHLLLTCIMSSLNRNHHPCPTLLGVFPTIIYWPFMVVANMNRYKFMQFI